MLQPASSKKLHFTWFHHCVVPKLKWQCANLCLITSPTDNVKGYSGDLRGRPVEVHAARVHARVGRQHAVQNQHPGHVAPAEEPAAAERAAVGPVAGPLVPLAPRVVGVYRPGHDTSYSSNRLL
jgi:hypothetical protein